MVNIQGADTFFFLGAARQNFLEERATKAEAALKAAREEVPLLNVCMYMCTDTHTLSLSHTHTGGAAQGSTKPHAV